MFKDKNYGLDIDLINTVRSVVTEGIKIEERPDVPTVKADKGPHKTKPQDTPKRVQDKADKNEKEAMKESVVIAKFSKYLDENFHVDQLTEEEIQWIYENEFVNQLDEEERSFFGRVLDYLPGYKQSRKNLEAKAKELKGKTTLDAIGTTLKDFAGKAPSALAYIPAGRAASTAVNAARAVATRSPTSTAVREPTTAVATRRPTSSAGPQGQRTGANSGGNRGIDPKKARENAQTLRTQEQIAAQRRAAAALTGGAAATAGLSAVTGSNTDKGGANAKSNVPTKDIGDEILRSKKQAEIEARTKRVSGPGEGPATSNAPEIKVEKTPAKSTAPVKPSPKAKREQRTSFKPAKQSWTQRQHSNYATGGPSIFTPES